MLKHDEIKRQVEDITFNLKVNDGKSTDVTFQVINIEAEPKAKTGKVLVNASTFLGNGYEPLNLSIKISEEKEVILSYRDVVWEDIFDINAITEELDDDKYEDDVTKEFVY